jgi:hypothetical protein
MNKIFKTPKILIGLILSASCATASATVFNITEVLNGIDDNFKFSGFHFAGEDSDPDADPLNNDGSALTGTQITRFLSTPVSGTYDDVTGAINMVLSLDPDSFNIGGANPGDMGYVNPGTVTFFGNMLFDAVMNPPELTLNPSATLDAVFSDVGIDEMAWLQNTSLSFGAGLVNCCANAIQRPNSFDGTTMSLWGSSSQLGLDLRIALTSVPVPAAVWLFGSGLLGLVAVARRKSA